MEEKGKLLCSKSLFALLKLLLLLKFALLLMNNRPNISEELHSPYIYFIRTFCAVPCEAVRLCKNFSQRCVSMCVNNSLLSPNVLVLVIYAAVPKTSYLCSFFYSSLGNKVTVNLTITKKYSTTFPLFFPSIPLFLNDFYKRIFIQKAVYGKIEEFGILCLPVTIFIEFCFGSPIFSFRYHWKQ